MRATLPLLVFLLILGTNAGCKKQPVGGAGPPAPIVLSPAVKSFQTQWNDTISFNLRDLGYDSEAYYTPIVSNSAAYRTKKESGAEARSEITVNWSEEFWDRYRLFGSFDALDDVAQCDRLMLGGGGITSDGAYWPGNGLVVVMDSETHEVLLILVSPAE